MASNVLHQVSAAELKVAEMIKLPVILRGRPDPRETIGDAIAWLDALAETARAEAALTGEFIRPVMLLQAEAKSSTRQTLHAEEVKKLLVDDFRVPEAHIVIATGDSRGLDGVNLFDPACELRFIITQQALREGWDCSFAYVLCSVAEQRSPRAVEQLLGRVLRLPYATRKKKDDLNCAYAFVTTTSFSQAAENLKDGLVTHGFDKVEANSLVVARPDHLPGLEEGGSAYIYSEDLPEGVDAAAVKPLIEAATNGRIQIDAQSGMMTTRGAISDYDRQAAVAVAPAIEQVFQTLVPKSRGAHFATPPEDAEAISFHVPRLVVRRGNKWQLFDRTHFLDIPWKLEEADPKAIMNYFTPPQVQGDEARLDLDERQELKVKFVSDLHQQLTLPHSLRGWTKTGLVNWIDRTFPASSRRDITRVSSTLFIANALDVISAQTGMTIDALARANFRLVDAFNKVIAYHRGVRETEAYQRALLPQNASEFQANSELPLIFEEKNYAYNQPYKGSVAFQKHLFRIIGDLDASGEEHDCAVAIDRHPRVKAWLRNTARQDHSFWLQTSSDKFYPDFVVLLEDGRILVVEYKGAPYLTNDDSREKGLIGGLWADRSAGKCLFLMFGDREFARLDRLIQGT